LPPTALPLPLLATLLFMIMGPVTLMPMFAALVGSKTAGERARIAGSACFIAAITLALAVFAGTGTMIKVGTSRSALIIAAGLILTLQSLWAVLGVRTPRPEAAPHEAGSNFALSPVAIPGIVSPLVVAILVIFASYFPAGHDLMIIFLIALGVLVVDFVALVAAPIVMGLIGMAPLIVLGAVFGVLQVALGIEMILSGLGIAGVLTFSAMQ
jgi:multiple antibiotic resistance protein